MDGFEIEITIRRVSTSGGLALYLDDDLTKAQAAQLLWSVAMQLCCAEEAAGAGKASDPPIPQIVTGP